MNVAALFTPENLAALATLTVMEIVLGIDNLVFNSILVGRLPEHQRARGMKIGLAMALIGRLGLLFGIGWIMGLTKDLFHLFGMGFTGKHLILLGGGLFLMTKATLEIYEKVEGDPHGPTAGSGAATMASVIGQVLVMDLVFSLDSVITAVGMAKEIWVMAAAMILAMVVMVATAEGTRKFIERHPSVKILALSFLLLIGVMLVAEGVPSEKVHMNRGYVYFAMGFSVVIEILNMRFRKKQAKKNGEAAAEA